MEPLDPADSPWGHREPPYAIHVMGLCPYPIAPRQPVITSPGEGEGEEGVTEDGEDDMVVVTVVEKDDELVEVIPVSNSTHPRPAYKQTTWIWIGPRGRPTRTLAQRTGAREAERISPEIGPEVWPPPPPLPPGGTIHTKLPIVA
jgi:hypothetical protein